MNKKVISEQDYNNLIKFKTIADDAIDVINESVELAEKLVKAQDDHMFEYIWNSDASTLKDVLRTMDIEVASPIEEINRFITEAQIRPENRNKYTLYVSDVYYNALMDIKHPGLGPFYNASIDHSGLEIRKRDHRVEELFITPDNFIIILPKET